MSRSKKKTPIIGNAGTSDKEDKRRANRVFRRREKDAIRKDKDPPEDLNEVSDVWDFSKDGKQMINLEDHPELVRK